MKQYLRQLPPVHELQRDGRFEKILRTSELSQDQLTKVIQNEINDLREQILSESLAIESLADQSLTDLIFQNAEGKVIRDSQDRLTKVINGTGTVLHTNLGRARLSDKAIEHVADVARNYSNLEYQIEEGKRGSRHDIIEDLLREVTGAEAAMVVNNNAAAVFLVLRALAKDKEVVVSRGQLVEIGGSFRISSIMEESGAQLVEVGTTNKTHLYDYENAISEDTAMMMKVHTSNFKTIGFTESVATEELATLKDQYKQLLLYEDLGSGALYDLKQHGIGDEPVVKDTIQAGIDVVTFSGDKLLGGPQAGIIVGKKDIITQLKKHQLARVLRVDKMTLAALEQTLKTYLMGDEARESLPTIRDITRTADEIKEQTEGFVQDIQAATTDYRMAIQKSTSQIGGGTMPGVELPTFVAAITHEKMSANELAANLRGAKPAIVTRIQDDQVLIDFRTITREDMPDLINGFLQVTHLAEI
ncbi:L-seryl-tRNA(Sec) selenium transferase [Tuberibacillus sp. Marseille-P3662]|uniref:L-seryl-tRNA(Sec) selenium transferase n=1 Tax=Tuberibacillus sp. Marseille-P3662 TaxID=1965358 RepID=UPI000A1CC1A8|nr:L-seryl-tRNA(Sec) selenium transferase [Tuberibacillus sp. Marseille-P3662]